MRTSFNDELAADVRDRVLDFIDRGEGGAMAAVYAVARALLEVAERYQDDGHYVGSDIVGRAGDALRNLQ